MTVAIDGRFANASGARKFARPSIQIAVCLS
jgi:hypothetical protein